MRYSVLARRHVHRMSLIEQIRRRNVHRVALAYVAGGWLIVQVAETLLPAFGLEPEVLRVILIALAIGFVPALVLSWKFEWTPSGFVRDAQVPAADRGLSSKTLDRAITVFLVVAVAYFAVDKFILREGGPEFGERSIAVLPFQTLGGSGSQDALGSGIAVELTNLLWTIPQLRVTGTTTTSTFGQGDIDILAAARKMDVSHILVGSVRRHDDRVRVAVQLVDADEDTQLWSDVYERTLDDIFEIQDDIAARVVGQLRLKLSDEPPTSEQINPEAYELYLRGDHLSHVVRTPEAFDEAVEVLERAVELEPAYVPALWALARSIENQVDPSDTVAVQAANKRVRALVDRMVELAPDSSYANAWLWYLARKDGKDLQTQFNYLERAVAGGTDSNLYFQQTFAARELGRLGRIDEAVALLEYVLKRDPGNPATVYNLAFLMRQAGRHREAAEKLEGILEWHDPTPDLYWSLGVAWLIAGEAGKALEYFDQDPNTGDLGRVLALYTLGREQEFEAEFEALKASSTSVEGIARVYAWSGQNDLAFEYLDRMVEEMGRDWAARVDTDLYEPIKSDPRWQEFLDKNGVKKEDLSDIEFDPPLPPEVVAEVERMRAERERNKEVSL
ncbi:MAG: tetratricopeptide repeat protein [Woeseiaceae bacterium]